MMNHWMDNRIAGVRLERPPMALPLQVSTADEEEAARRDSFLSRVTEVIHQYHECCEAAVVSLLDEYGMLDHELLIHKHYAGAPGSNIITELFYGEKVLVRLVRKEMSFVVESYVPSNQKTESDRVRIPRDGAQEDTEVDGNSANEITPEG